MPAIRRYGCDDCGHEFEVFHMSMDEPPPADCPKCTAAAMKQVPNWKGAHGSNVGKAGDLAAQVTMETYGLTDIKDARREGDVAAPTPQMQTPEGKKMLELLDKKGGMFSQGAVPAAAAPQGGQMMSTKAVLDAARAIPRGEKVPNFERFHAGLRSRPVRDNTEERARAMSIPDAQNKGVGR